jgi:hypothetical protein
MYSRHSRISRFYELQLKVIGKKGWSKDISYLILLGHFYYILYEIILEFTMKSSLKNLEKRVENLEKLVRDFRTVKSRNDVWEELEKVVRIQNRNRRIQA